MPPSTESSAKRQKVDGKIMISDLPVDEFVSMMDNYKGSEVTIIVQNREYKLPKLLVCYNSPVFKAAFNGKSKEGQEQKMTLDASIGVFEIAIKWMYTGQVGPQPRFMADSDYLSQLLEFLNLTDLLNLLGPFDLVTQNIRLMLSKGTILCSKHIEYAMKQPAGTQARTIILKACVGPYLQSLGWSCVNNVDGKVCDFKFKKELKELAGFAVELFQLFDETIRKQVGWTRNQRKIVDPATGEPMYYKP